MYFRLVMTFSPVEGCHFLCDQAKKQIYFLVVKSFGIKKRFHLNGNTTMYRVLSTDLKVSVMSNFLAINKKIV